MLVGWIACGNLLMEIGAVLLVPVCEMGRLGQSYCVTELGGEGGADGGNASCSGLLLGQTEATLLVLIYVDRTDLGQCMKQY